MPAFPCFASAIITSAAPARRPTVLALTQLLRELGETPVVLSRGYGGRLRGPVDGRSAIGTPLPMSATNR